MTLAIVERSNDGEKNIRTATKDDLIKYHPQCKSCGKTKGIHAKPDEVFCLWFNKPVRSDGYCSDHTELTNG